MPPEISDTMAAVFLPGSDSLSFPLPMAKLFDDFVFAEVMMQLCTVLSLRRSIELVLRDANSVEGSI